MRIVKWIPPLVLTLLSVGCMQVDYGIVLEDDLSGTTDLDITIDLDRIAYSAALVQAAFEGTGEPPTEEQVEAARDMILSEMDSDEKFDEADMRAELEEDLPDGMTLRYATQERDELKHTVRLGFAFDHVDRLREFEMRDDDEDDHVPGVEHSRPFEGLEIIERGNEVIVRNEPIDPIDDMSDSPMVSEQMVDNMMKDLSVTFRLETPFDILEHNATRRDGRTLVWVFDYERLKQDEPAGIYARLRRR
jgi:hypothetical protein